MTRSAVGDYYTAAGYDLISCAWLQQLCRTTDNLHFCSSYFLHDLQRLYYLQQLQMITVAVHDYGCSPDRSSCSWLQQQLYVTTTTAVRDYYSSCTWLLQATISLYDYYRRCTWLLQPLNVTITAAVRDYYNSCTWLLQQLYVILHQLEESTTATICHYYSSCTWLLPQLCMSMTLWRGFAWCGVDPVQELCNSPFSYLRMEPLGIRILEHYCLSYLRWGGGFEPSLSR